MRDPLERFLVKVDFTEDCWEWTAVRQKKGYGQFRAGTMRQAHLWLWEQVVGLVPEGLELDHLCKNRGCVNPDHLEPVTHRVNVARSESNSVALKAVWARKHAERTHCANGHEFTEENTLWCRGKRMCRTCNTQKARDWRARRDAQAPTAQSVSASGNNAAAGRARARSEVPWSSVPSRPDIPGGG